MNNTKKKVAIAIACIAVLGGGITAGLFLGGDKQDGGSNSSMIEQADNSSPDTSASPNDSQSADDSAIGTDSSSKVDDSSALDEDIPEGSTGEYDLVTYNGVEYKLYKLDNYQYRLSWVYDENIPIEAYHMDIPDTDPEREDYIWGHDLVPDYTYKMYEDITDKADAYFQYRCTWDGINNVDKAREFAEKLAGIEEDVEELYNDLAETYQIWCYDGKLMDDLHFISSDECYVNYAYKCLVKSKNAFSQPDSTACVIIYGDLYFKRINGEWQITKIEIRNSVPFAQYYLERNERNEPIFSQREEFEG